MTEIDIAFAILAGIVVVVSIVARNWKPLLWVACIAASYVLSDFAWRSDLAAMEAAGLTAIGDGAVCLMFYFFWRERWEMMIWRLYQISCTISIYYAATSLHLTWGMAHNVYSTLLEIINALALLSMLGTSLTKLIGMVHGPAVHSNRFLHLTLVAISRRRTSVPFTRRAH